MDPYSIFLLFFGSLLVVAAWQWRRNLGFGVRRSVIYIDEGKKGKLLQSNMHGLQGKPDYIEQAGRYLVPVEFKSTPAPLQPYYSHVLQLFAYCLLVEDAYGKPVKEGKLVYNGRTFILPFGPQQRQDVLRAINRLRLGGKISRNHKDAGRCVSCSFRDQCADRLA